MNRPAHPPSWRSLLRRARRLRCPVCGKGRLFDGIYKMDVHCASCAFRFEREDGYFLGAIYINYIATGTVLVATVLFHNLVAPIPSGLLIPGGVAFGVLFPVWFSRYTRALWLAIDLRYHWPEERDFGPRRE